MATRRTTEKEYVFRYMDRDRNELTRKVYVFNNLKEARKHANLLLANSMQDGLYKIDIMPL